MLELAAGDSGGQNRAIRGIVEIAVGDQGDSFLIGPAETRQPLFLIAVDRGGVGIGAEASDAVTGRAVPRLIR